MPIYSIFIASMACAINVIALLWCIVRCVLYMLIRSMLFPFFHLYLDVHFHMPSFRTPVFRGIHFMLFDIIFIVSCPIWPHIFIHFCIIYLCREYECPLRLRIYHFRFAMAYAFAILTITWEITRWCPMTINIFPHVDDCANYSPITLYYCTFYARIIFPKMIWDYTFIYNCPYFSLGTKSPKYYLTH